MFRSARILPIVGVAIALSACAPSHSQSEIDAAHSKLEAYDSASPLTTERRKEIATFLYNSFGSAKGNIALAEISSVKLDLDSIQLGNDIVRQPYYCVRTRSRGLLGLEGVQEYKVAIVEVAPGRHLFKKASSSSGRIYACEMKVSYQPFPEFMEFYPQNGR